MSLDQLARGLLLAASLAGCASIIGADFDELGPARACGNCSTGGAEAGRAAGAASGLGGMSAFGGAGSAGRGTAAGGSAASGMGGTVAGSGEEVEGGSAGEGGGGAVDPCASHVECIDRHEGQPYVCRRANCVPITTEACPILLPRARGLEYLRRESPIVVGAFAGVAAPDFEDPSSVNFDLAFTEFNEAAFGGIALGTRPLVAVVCNSELPDVLPALRHLTLEVGVEGVLSALSPEKLLAAYEHTTSPGYLNARGNDVFFLSDSAADLRLSNLADRGLVWHMLGSPRVLAATTAGLVRHIELRVLSERAQNHALTGVDDPATAGPLRLTLVTAGNPDLLDAASVLTSGDLAHPSSNLTFNDELAVSQPGSFRRSGLDAAEILANPPHIVVALGGAELAALIDEVESSWGQSGNPQGFMRPFWVLYESAAHAPGLPDTVAKLEAVSPPLSQRLVGVDFATSQEQRAQVLYSAYESRLFEFYQGTRLESVLASTENHYDAAYALIYAYAAAASNGSHVSATDLREALENRVFSSESDAESVSVGPAYVPRAVQVLGTPTSRLSLYGTMGPPSFERSSGTRVTATSAWCFEPGNVERPYVYDALLYDSGADDFYAPPGGPGSCIAQY